MSNHSTLLGFKYSLDQSAISLSPPKGSRQIAFLKRSGDSLCWVHTDDPHHDANKLYASFRGIPSSSWVQLDLEDLGLETQDFEDSRQESFGRDTSLEVGLQDFVGAGWMNKDAFERSNTPVLMVACRHKDTRIWRITKLKESPGDPGDSSFYDRQADSDIIIPLVQPRRIESDSGVYFVG
jgi:hypothetical protein